MEEKNDIEVVVDNEGKDLEISPVYEHLKVAKPNPKEEKDKIIIPEEMKKDDDEKKDDEEKSDDDNNN